MIELVYKFGYLLKNLRDAAKWESRETLTEEILILQEILPICTSQIARTVVSTYSFELLSDLLYLLDLNSPDLICSQNIHNKLWV